MPVGERVLRPRRVICPMSALTELRMIVGTAAVLAVCAVLAVAIGTIARRGAAAVAAVIALIVAPYVLAVSIAVLPLGAADWLMRVTPAAAFAVEQTVVQYPQVDDVYARLATSRCRRGPDSRCCARGPPSSSALAALALNRRDA